MPRSLFLRHRVPCWLCLTCNVTCAAPSLSVAGAERTTFILLKKNLHCNAKMLTGKWGSHLLLLQLETELWHSILSSGGCCAPSVTVADFKVRSILELLKHSPLCDSEGFFYYFFVAKTPVSLAGYISDYSNNMWNEYDSYEMHSQLLGLNPSSSAWWSANWIFDRDFIRSKRTIKPTLQ